MPIKEKKYSSAIRLISAIAATGIGYAIGGPFGKEILAGIGVNLSSDVLSNATIGEKLRRRWFKALPNQDIQVALANAIKNAIRSLETQYFEDKHLSKGKEISARNFFGILEEDLVESVVGYLAEAETQKEIESYLFPGTPGEQPFQRLTQSLDHRFLKQDNEHADPAMMIFFQERFHEEVQLRFTEELINTPRAWNTFQKLILEDLQLGIKNIQEDTKGIKSDTRRIIELLNKREAASQAFFLTAVPTLPAHFLTRQEYLSRLNEMVLPNIGQPSDNKVTALQGLPGVGKSVLAAAFTRADETRLAFQDGVLWVTIGENPDLLKALNVVIRGIKNDEVAFQSQETAFNRLSQLLEDKNCLVILDDVWKVDHVTPFVNSLGSNCRLLFTTREGTLVSNLGANNCQIDLLSDAAAVQLLLDWVKEKDKQGEQDVVKNLAKECGNLPLALSLCGALANQGESWIDLYEALQEAELDYIDEKLPNYPYRNVFRSLEVSMNVLARENEAYAERYKELVVFPSDEMIPEAVIVKLWSNSGEMNPRRAKRLLVTLSNKQLIQIEGMAPNRRISMHDLQHDYLSVVVKDQITLHQQLVATYKEELTDVMWHTLPNDGYIHAHLTYHLEEAGYSEQIYTLLKEENKDGRNGWYEVLDRQGENASYLADVERAWGLAKNANMQEVDKDGKASQFSREVRYALYLSSVYSAVAKIPPRLLKLGLKYGALSWPQARAYAAMHNVPVNSAYALLHTLPDDTELKEKQLASIMETADEIPQNFERMQFFAELAREHDLPETIVNEIFKRAKKCWLDAVHSRLVDSLILKLNDIQLEDAISLSNNWIPSEEGLMARVSIAKRLPNQRSELVSSIKFGLIFLKPSINMVKVLCEVSSWWPEAIEHALDISEKVLTRLKQGKGDWRDINRHMVEIFIALGSAKLSKPQLEKAKKLFDVAPVYFKLKHRIISICYLAGQFSEEQRVYISNLFNSIKHNLSGNSDEDLGVAFLSFFLPKSERENAIIEGMEKLVKYAGQSASESGYIGRLSPFEIKQKELALSLISELPPNAIDLAFTSANKITDSKSRAEVLEQLMPLLPDEQDTDPLNRRKDILKKEIQKCKAFNDTKSQALTIAALIPFLPENQGSTIAKNTFNPIAEESLEIFNPKYSYQVKNYKDKSEYLNLFSKFAPFLPEQQREKISSSLLDTIKADKVDHNYSDDHFASFAQYLPKSRIDECKKVAEKDDHWLTLVTLVPHLPSNEAQRIINKYLEIAEEWWAHEMPEEFVKALKILVPECPLSKGQLDLAFRLSWHVQWKGYALLANALKILDPHLPISIQHEEYEEALTSGDIKRLCVICPYLPKTERSSAILETYNKVLQLEDHQYRMSNLQLIAAHVDHSRLAEDLSDILQKTISIPDHKLRAEILCQLVQIGELSPAEQLDALEEILTSSVKANENRAFLLNCIGEIAEMLDQLGGYVLVEETLAAIQDTASWWP